VTRIRIQPADRLEAAQPDLEPLADELRAAGFEVEFTETAISGYGVTWWEVFHFFIDETERHAIDVAIDAVAGTFIVWATRRFKGGGRGRAESAPKHATLYGADGKPLKEITIERDEEPVIVTPREKASED
jgi:hypothetical protein